MRKHTILELRKLSYYDIYYGKGEDDCGVKAVLDMLHCDIEVIVVT